MRFVNREQFLKLPANTVFLEYDPHVLGSICIKGDTINYMEFRVQELTEVLETGDSHCYSILEDAIESGNSFDLDLNCSGRDQLFDEDQLFLVWEQKDVIQLVARLTACIER